MVSPIVFIAFGGVGIATGIVSAVCSGVHLLRAIHRDNRLEEEQRILSLSHSLGGSLDVELGLASELNGAECPGLTIHTKWPCALRCRGCYARARWSRDRKLFDHHVLCISETPMSDLSYECTTCHHVVTGAATFAEHRRQCKSEPKKPTKNDISMIKKSIRHQASIISMGSVQQYQQEYKRRLSFC